jgi:hypothetical protein
VLFLSDYVKAFGVFVELFLEYLKHIFMFLVEYHLKYMIDNVLVISVIAQIDLKDVNKVKVVKHKEDKSHFPKNDSFHPLCNHMSCIQYREHEQYCHCNVCNGVTS